MTKKELLALPYADFREEIPLLDDLYIIPTMRLHDSGYRIIEVIGGKRDKDFEGYEYLKRIGLGTDVIDYGSFMKDNPRIKMDVPSDCNCIRIFADYGYKIKVGFRLSSFTFEQVEDKKGK